LTGPATFADFLELLPFVADRVADLLPF